jgi:uracil-DNA glycosylase
VSSPLAGEAQAMLDRMLVHVLAMEATDVWTVAPVACPTCAALVRSQVEAVAPRAILALGPAAQALTGLSGRGLWGRWAGAEALATFHPDELLRAPDDKRHAFAHLKDVARRVS